ncbi:MAG: hypothetical protein GX205_02750 [Firmicutes bacterium]|nr:hypothetical protein [Bacillota bacterium]
MWVDENKTLWEERNRDLWQLPILSQDGEYLGNVIGQIVEPNEYLVRYLVAFSPGQQKRFLVPCETVLAIDQVVYCRVSAADLEQLPAFQTEISRNLEEKIYQMVDSTPYWEQ